MSKWNVVAWGPGSMMWLHAGFAVTLAACGADVHSAIDSRPNANDVSSIEPDLAASDAEPVNAVRSEVIAPDAVARVAPTPSAHVDAEPDVQPAANEAPAVVDPIVESVEADDDAVEHLPQPAATSMPVAARGQAVVAYNGVFYLFGGASADDAAVYENHPGQPIEDPTLYTAVWTYDPVAEQWSRKSNMPAGVYVLSAHALGDKIYVVSGYGRNWFDTSVQVYDPATDSWTLQASTRTRRYTFASEAVGGKVYVIGGQGPSDNDFHSWPYSSAVEIFDPATGWKTGASLPEPVSAAASCTANGRIYVFGGDVNNFTSIYDVKTDSWSRGTPPPTVRNGHTCVRVGKLFYLLGGRNETGSLDIVESYDPSTDTWQSSGHLVLGRHWAGAAALGQYVWMFGGAREQDVNGLLSDVEAFETAPQP